MPVPIAYLIVIMIWSTTPLAIVWSGESVSPILAAFVRMSIAAPVGTLLLRWFKIKLPMDKNAKKIYLFSAVNIYLGMSLTYLGSKGISSGVLSLIYGMSPLISGVLATKLLNEPRFTLIRQLALTIALAGLGVVFADNIQLNSDNLPGLILVFIGMCCFSLSAVLVKSVKINIHPLATTVGGLWISLPFYALTWWLLEGNLAIEQWQMKSVAAIIYLSIFGSLLGFVAYYHVLQRLSAATVAMITLITPLLAIMWGHLLNHEVLTLNLMIGTVIILLGLTLYTFAGRIAGKKRKIISANE